MTVLYVIVAVLLFGFLIFIHELGHFLCARLFKVTVEEFAIGMGPAVFTKVSKKSGTAYSLRILPFGGFVRMAGEDGESDDENAFYKKAVWKRMIITVAGVTMNILLGIVVMCIYVATSSVIGSTTVADFPNGESVIYDSGIREGDTIIKVDGKKVHIYSQMYYEIMYNGYEPIDITVIRDGETITIPDVSFPVVESDGTSFGTIDFRVERQEKTFFAVAKEAYYQSFTTIKMIWDSLGGLLSGRYSVSGVSGPVGVTEALVDAAKTGVRNFVYLSVVISMNLGVMNLLPLPALDGGRLFFQLIELVARRPVNRKVEEYIHAVGLVILMLLMVVIVLKDIISLF